MYPIYLSGHLCLIFQHTCHRNMGPYITSLAVRHSRLDKHNISKRNISSFTDQTLFVSFVYAFHTFSSLFTCNS